MKKQNVLSLLKFAELLINARVAYNNIKNDEEAKKTANMFGKRSLVYFAVFAVLGGIAGALIYWCVTHFASTLIFLSILGFIASVYLLLYALGFYILSFNLAIKQKKLNNKAVGIIALILNITLLVAVLIALVILLITIKTKG